MNESLGVVLHDLIFIITTFFCVIRKSCLLSTPLKNVLHHNKFDQVLNSTLLLSIRFYSFQLNIINLFLNSKFTSSVCKIGSTARWYFCIVVLHNLVFGCGQPVKGAIKSSWAVTWSLWWRCYPGVYWCSDCLCLVYSPRQITFFHPRLKVGYHIDVDKCTSGLPLLWSRFPN